ncbi:MAG: zinc ribbon domain-containing protein [Longimicrobiales bacterium]
MKCPSCGTETTGRFCPECGTPLSDAKCARCSATLVPGARFCTQCGHAARASGLGGHTGWYVAAGVLVVMIGLVWILVASDRAKTAATGTNAGAGSTNGSPPPLTGTPREQADRLFNRIMSERESGDTAKARTFLPMGIQAYKQAGELEADGMYHLALLQASAGQTADAIATAEQMLKADPKNLLALGAAAEAAEGAGDGVAAASYYSRFLAAYPAEKTRSSAEYLDHAKILPLYEQAARRYLRKP